MFKFIVLAFSFNKGIFFLLTCLFNLCLFFLIQIMTEHKALSSTFLNSSTRAYIFKISRYAPVTSTEIDDLSY